MLGELLRALRLFGDGRVALGPLAWARVGDGAWSAVALGAAGRPHGMLVVTAEQEDELRAFCNLVSRRAPHGNELAWALRRFELGCERESSYEALSDHLLALRALLEPEGPSSGLLAGRLAALCATPEHRAALTERIVAAVALERALIAGSPVKRAGGQALCRGGGRPSAGAAAATSSADTSPPISPPSPMGCWPRRRPRRTTARPRRRPPSRSLPERERSGEQVLCHSGQACEVLDVFVKWGTSTGLP